MIGYSSAAKRALAHFFRPFNDLDVFVEDTSRRNLYETLINRILEGKAKVSRVFQIGGRNQVLDACKQDQNNNDRRCRIYLIDGDLDLLLGREAPNLSFLYRLSVYSSENLVLCMNAVHQVAYECLANQSMPLVQERVGYDTFINSIEKDLLDLFTVYAAAHYLDKEIKTVKFHVFHMCDTAGGPPRLNKDKLAQRIANMQVCLKSKFTTKQLDQKINEIRDRITEKKLTAVQVVSGKSYIAPLLWAHLKGAVRYKGSQDTLLVQLATHCRLDIDPNLSSAIRAAAKGW
jgi:hypothetical protein